MSTELQPACADNVEFIAGTVFSSPAPSKGRARAIERNDIHGVVLAGGRSSRMGCDKALLRFRGRPLIEHTMDILRNTGLPVSISGWRADLAHLAPVFVDIEPPQGIRLSDACCSVAGFSSGLELWAKREWWGSGGAGLRWRRWLRNLRRAG